MKVLKKILFLCGLSVAMTFAVSAQRNDQKKPPPPKGTPPVVTPQPKDPKKGNPRPDDKKPKRPDYMFFAIKED